MNHAENIREHISQLERTILYEEWTMDAQYPYSENDYEFVDGEKYFTVEYLKSMPSGYAYRLARYETLVQMKDILEGLLESAVEDPLNQPRFKIVFDDEEEDDGGNASWN